MRIILEWVKTLLVLSYLVLNALIIANIKLINLGIIYKIYNSYFLDNQISLRKSFLI